jgi:hypothetical protein
MGVVSSPGATFDAVGEHVRADRRLISLTVPRGAAPSAPPAALSQVVVPIKTGDGSNVWRLDLGRVFALGDHQAAPRFAQWVSTFSTRVVLAETWVAGTLGRLLVNAGFTNPLSKALADHEFVALGPDSAAAVSSTTPTELDANGRCFGLVNSDANRIIPGRLWIPQGRTWVLSRSEKAVVFCGESGVSVTSSDVDNPIDLVGVTGWELAGDGLEVETESGFCTTLTGGAASLLAAQAPGALSVRVADAPASVGINSLLRKLRSSLDLAAERQRYCLVGSDMPQSAD